MTRAVRDRILKDANGDIGDHLRNHIHLTNCIHLKNHIHKHSPILHDRPLMRELMALQRSRSLRDPSTSPPRRHSPLTASDLAVKSCEIIGSAGWRRSAGVDRPTACRRLSSGSSPTVQELTATSNVSPGKVDRLVNGTGLASKHTGKSGPLDGTTRIKNKESDNISHGMRADQDDEYGMHLSGGAVPGRYEQNGRKKGVVNGQQSLDSFPKTLSAQLNEVRGDSSGDNAVASSNARLSGRHAQREAAVSDHPEPSFRGSCIGLNRVRRRKFRKIKRTQPFSTARDTRYQDAFSAASNSSVRAVGHQDCQTEEVEEGYKEHGVTRIPRNGCGIPWNWSRIHDSGKSFLDMAGRSLSCGLSDPKLRRGGSASQGMDAPEAFDRSSSGSKSDVEALPLLVNGYGSQESSENAGWEHDYSGELGIFADSLLRRDTESDLASEGRSGDRDKLRRDYRGMHQSLTQKYMPRTFRDLVGQNLVVQALSNAVVQRKVGLLYVLYGPHGTGKTSCARILARALNCRSVEHPKPCGFCSSCIAHDLGKNKNIKEVGPAGNFNSEGILDLLDEMMALQQRSQYRVYIFDDCDNLSPEFWSSISKVIDQAPRRVVFMLVCSNLDVLPHIIISRCQKFFFPKLKDTDIIYALKWISTKEKFEVDKDAMKLIACRSDGSLRDAEMTLEQLSLLGQRISVALVQELVGLISDEKLVDLLDLALSADTVNTVKSLREIMETGVEPLALMSQLATVVTDILAGTYDFSKERQRRRFFRQHALAKEDMEKLRHALKTLSEAEKQLRMSSDKLTWLTAALLQLAPDQQYTLPRSPTEPCFNRSQVDLNDSSGKDTPRRSNVSHDSPPHSKRGLKSSTGDRRKHGGNGSHISLAQQITANQAYTEMGNGRSSFQKSSTEIEDIWLEVIEKLQIGCIRELLYQEGKLMSVNYGPAATVELMFWSSEAKSKAKKFWAYILQAFESTLGCPVIIDIRSAGSRQGQVGGGGGGTGTPLTLPSSKDLSSSQLNTNTELIPNSQVRPVLGYDMNMNMNMIGQKQNGVGSVTSEIVEVNNSSAAGGDEVDLNGHAGDYNGESSVKREGIDIIRSRNDNVERRRSPREEKQCRSLVRGRVSLAHVIQQADGYMKSNNTSVWTRRKAVSIAEKMEEENMRLESKCRSSLVCWKACRATRRKFCKLKIGSRIRRSGSMLKLTSCGRCVCLRSPNSPAR